MDRVVIAGGNVVDGTGGPAADAPGPAGDFDITNNRINHNTKLCDEEPPAVSGVGVAHIWA